MNLPLLSVFLFFLAFQANVYSQSGTIKGKILDAKTNEPLIGASVLIEGTTNGAAADLDGNYVINNVGAGSYTLIASYVAYQNETKTGIVVERGKETVVDFLLKTDDISLDEVEVVARANRESENILLMEQRKALVATQSVGARELSRKGISDARSAVAQVSGISRQEGVKNVFVRGLGDRYNSTLLNGFPIPSEDPEYKNIALEFFDTGVIQSIEVNKVFSGNSISDVGGAIINISSRELVTDKAFSVDVSGGINSEAVGVDFLRAEGANYFGFANNNKSADNQFNFPNSLDPRDVSFPLNHSYGISGGKLFRIGENNNPFSFFVVTSFSSDYSYTKETLRRIVTNGEITRDQIGEKFTKSVNALALVNMNYEINRKHNLSYNFMLLHAGNEYVNEYSGKDVHTYLDEDDYTSGYTRRQQVNDNLLLTHQLMSELSLTDKLKLDAGISYNKIKGLEPDRRVNNLTQFRDESSTWYRFTSGDRQNRFFSELHEDDFNIKASLNYKLEDRFDNEHSNFIIGYNGRFVDNDFSAKEYNYDIFPDRLQLDELKIDDWYNQENFSQGKFGYRNIILNSYSVQKMVNSAYVDFIYQLAPRLTGDVGVKFDFVDIDIDHRNIQELPGETKVEKFYWLPNLNLKYDINDKNILRLGASKSYTLPQSKEFTPFVYVNVSFNSQGNPNLKPSENYNLDLKWDYHLTPSELISLTAFYKMIDKPIARIEKGNSAGLLEYHNISDRANVAGVELEVRKNIFNHVNTSTSKINRLSLGLNASYIYSNLKLYSDFVSGSEQQSTELEGASPFLLNFDISYNYAKGEKNLILSLVSSYFSDRIHTIGTLGYKDIIEKGVYTLDFVSSYKLNKQISLNLKGANLFNPSYILKRKSSSGEEFILNEYEKGRSISLGISYSL